ARWLRGLVCRGGRWCGLGRSALCRCGGRLSLSHALADATADGLALDDRGEVEPGRRADAVEHRLHRLGVVCADEVRGAVFAGAADDRDVADRGVALRE